MKSRRKPNLDADTRSKILIVGVMCLTCLSLIFLFGRHWDNTSLQDKLRERTSRLSNWYMQSMGNGDIDCINEERLWRELYEIIGQENESYEEWRKRSKAEIWGQFWQEEADLMQYREAATKRAMEDPDMFEQAFREWLRDQRKGYHQR